MDGFTQIKSWDTAWQECQSTPLEDFKKIAALDDGEADTPIFVEPRT